VIEVRSMRFRLVPLLFPIQLRSLSVGPQLGDSQAFENRTGAETLPDLAFLMMA